MNEKSIFSSVKVVVLTLILVKLVGFIKQAVIAAYFGTSGDIDKFLLVSELMENMGAAVFSAIAISFLTIYIETLTNEGRHASSQLTSNVFSFFLPFVILLITVILVFSNQIAYIVAPGYKDIEQETISLYIKFFSITFLNMFIYYVCNAVLEAEKIFFPGKIVGIIRSIAVICAILCLSEKIGINAMFVGVISYYFIETVFILICIRNKIHFSISKPFKDARMKVLLKLSAPLFVSYGIVQIQGVVDKAIASGLSEGSIATLSYSGYLYNSTHSILIGGLCTVIFSYFSSYVAEKRNDLLLETLYKYIKISVIILTLIVTLFLLYSSDIVRIVYERGAFDGNSSYNVSLAFCAYSLGLVFLGIRDIMIRAHYAYKDNKQAMVNGIIGIGINICMSLLLSRYLGSTGIALATSISSLCIAIISCQTIKKNIKEFKISSLTKFFIKIVCTCIVTLFISVILNRFFEIEYFILDFIVKALISLIIYIIMLKFLQCDEINEVKKMLMDKLKGSK